MILPNNTSVIDTKKISGCAQKPLPTNGLLLITHNNSTGSPDRGCYVLGLGTDMLGVWGVGHKVSIEQFFGPKNYTVPDGTIFTFKR